jgi:RNA polymerase sigma factor (sigma-70 family)
MGKLEELVCVYQKVVREEKLELLRLPLPRKRMIELLIEFQQPTKQRRLSAKTLAYLITHFEKDWQHIENFIDEVDDLRISIDHWCDLRTFAEKTDEGKAKKWKKAFEQTAGIRAEVISLIADLIPKVRSSIVGYKYAQAGDLDSVGFLGLIKEMENFDSKRGVPFEAYARSWIYNTMVQFLRKDQLVNPSEKVLRTFRLYEKTFTNLQGVLGREPEDIEIANAMNITEEDLSNLLDIDTSVTSLDLPATKDEEYSLHEILGADEAAPYQQMENMALAMRLGEHMKTLDHAERTIVLLRWFPLDQSDLKGVPMTIDQAINRMKEISFQRILPRTVEGEKFLASKK